MGGGEGENFQIDVVRVFKLKKKWLNTSLVLRV
jgi:hypothetical protein